MTQAKFRPIIFNTGMVRAILNRNKTQTRRVIKPQPKPSEMRWTGARWEQYLGYPVGHDAPISPYGIPGDLLWIRETAYISPPNFSSMVDETHRDYENRPRIVAYCADYPDGHIEEAEDLGVKKTPSIFMPQWASRITLQIIQTRIEQLQSIDEEDAWKEGVQTRDEFIKLWDSINEKRGYEWKKNFWVWVIEFKVK